MRRLRNAFALGVLVGLVIALVRAVGERRRPQSATGTGHQALSPPPVARTRTVADSHDASVPTRSAKPPTIVPSRATAPPTGSPTSSTAAPEGAPPEGALPPVEVDPLPAPPPPEPAASAPATPAGPVPDADATWVAPVEGACPDGYPVKAKETSRIFHVPGGLSYDRTRPERCYPSPTAAEADGFRAAKR